MKPHYEGEKQLDPLTSEQIAAFRQSMAALEQMTRAILPRYWAWKSMQTSAGADPDGESNNVETHVAIFNRHYHGEMHFECVTTAGVRYSNNYHPRRQSTVPWWVILNPDWEAEMRRRWDEHKAESAERTERSRVNELENARKKMADLKTRYPELAGE